MSCYSVSVNRAGGGIEVLYGWDPNLITFFLMCVYEGTDDPVPGLVCIGRSRGECINPDEIDKRWPNWIKKPRSLKMTLYTDASKESPSVAVRIQPPKEE